MTKDEIAMEDKVAKEEKITKENESLEKYEKIAEALLFVSDLLSLSEIASCLDLDIKSTRKILSKLKEKYEVEGRGMRILQIEDSYQMSTAVEYYEYIQRLRQNTPKKVLTTALLETLAIVAYKQPVTKAQIEEIRGVSADHAVNKLLEYGLIVELGRSSLAGRALLFGTSPEFLRDFGFDSLKRLPDTEHFNPEESQKSLS